jgi:hypothetical protein
MSGTGIKLQSTANTSCRIPQDVYATDSSTHAVPADLYWLSMLIRNNDVITIMHQCVRHINALVTQVTIQKYVASHIKDT